jgi:hypothetical protein
MSRLGPVSSSAGRKPGTPTIGTATAGSGQATVTFTAPSYLGKPNSPLTYTVVSSPSSIQNTGSESPITVTGLSNETAYTFTVKLNNTVMDSDFSGASNSVTPIAPGPFFPFFPPFFPFFPFFPTFTTVDPPAPSGFTCTSTDISLAICNGAGCDNSGCATGGSCTNSPQNHRGQGC